MKSYTKQSLTAALIDISNQGWIKNRRHSNNGGVGNTLEDLLGIEENNLPLPNAAEWEPKTHRKSSQSLLTLFHTEPSPRAMKLVSNMLLPLYGWEHSQAGKKYPLNEKSFRQTVNSKGTDRGFYLSVDDETQRVVVKFNPEKVDKQNHASWLNDILKNVGAEGLNPEPYWGFGDLAGKLRTKLLNCFYAQAEVKREGGEEYYRYCEIYRCSDFSFDKFLSKLEDGYVYVDFDARTGHNHGTKFRVRQTDDIMQGLYDKVERLV